MRVRSGNEEHDSSSVWREYCWFGVVIANLAVNVRVIWNVFQLPRLTRRGRAVSLALVAHLGFIAAILGIISMASVRQYFNEPLLKLTQDVPSRGRLLCRLWKYCETVVLCVFPMNIVGIMYERTKCSQYFPRYGGKRNLTRLPLVFWTLSLLVCVPIGLMYDVDDTTGICQAVPLLNNLWITILYGLLRFQLFHVTPVAYIIHALVQIYAKVQRIHTWYHDSAPVSSTRGLFLVSGSGVTASSSRTMSSYYQRRFRSVQMVYTYLTSFILIWFATGVLFLAEVLLDLPMMFENTPSSFQEDFSFTEKYGMMLLLIYLYIFLSPCINLGLLEGIGWCICGHSDEITGFQDVDDVEALPPPPPPVPQLTDLSVVTPAWTGRQQRIIGQRLKNYDNDEIYLSATEMVTVGNPSVSIETVFSCNRGEGDPSCCTIRKLSPVSNLESDFGKENLVDRVHLKMKCQQLQKVSGRTKSYPEYGNTIGGNEHRINLEHDDDADVPPGKLPLAALPYVPQALPFPRLRIKQERALTW